MKHAGHLIGWLAGRQSGLTRQLAGAGGGRRPCSQPLPPLTHWQPAQAAAPALPPWCFSMHEPLPFAPVFFLPLLNQPISAFSASQLVSTAHHQAAPAAAGAPVCEAFYMPLQSTNSTPAWHALSADIFSCPPGSCPLCNDLSKLFLSLLVGSRAEVGYTDQTMWDGGREQSRIRGRASF